MWGRDLVFTCLIDVALNLCAGDLYLLVFHTKNKLLTTDNIFWLILDKIPGTSDVWLHLKENNIGKSIVYLHCDKMVIAIDNQLLTTHWWKYYWDRKCVLSCLLIATNDIFQSNYSQLIWHADKLTIAELNIDHAFNIWETSLCIFLMGGLYNVYCQYYAEHHDIMRPHQVGHTKIFF